jgi:hypothetical protein
MAKKSAMTTDQLERRLKRLAERREVLRIAMAAFGVRTEGGQQKIVSQKQSEWEDLHPATAKAKARRGQDPRKWVRTGRTIEALSQGRLEPKTSAQKGVRVTLSKSLNAVLVPETFRPDKGRKPKKEDQRAILFMHDRRRPFLKWYRDEVAAIEAKVAKEIEAIMAERGGQ